MDFLATATTETDRHLHEIESVRCFQRRVQIVFHLFGNSILNKLRHGDLHRFSIVLLTQFSTTTSKSTFIPRSKFKFSPKPLHSVLKSKSQPNHLPTHFQHFSVVSHGSSEFQEQVTQRNRQRLLSTWLAYRQGKHLSQDWTQGEFEHGSICSGTKPACRRARLSL